MTKRDLGILKMNKQQRFQIFLVILAASLAVIGSIIGGIITGFMIHEFTKIKSPLLLVSYEYSKGNATFTITNVNDFPAIGLRGLYKIEEAIGYREISFSKDTLKKGEKTIGTMYHSFLHWQLLELCESLVKNEFNDSEKSEVICDIEQKIILNFKCEGCEDNDFNFITPTQHTKIGVRAGCRKIYNKIVCSPETYRLNF